MQILIEVLSFGVRDATLVFRRAVTTLGTAAAPDAVARTLAPAAAILHSTSWRWVDGRLVLTYAAVGEGDPGPDAVPVGQAGVVGSGDPAAPSPPDVPMAAVAGHAARHLAWLRRHDEVVATALAALPELWHALDEHLPAMAGQLPSPATEAVR